MGREKLVADNLLRQMKKQIQTYKLISKLSNFRGLLKRLPEDTIAVSRRFISFHLFPFAHFSTLSPPPLHIRYKSAFSIRVYTQTIRKMMTSLHLF